MSDASQVLTRREGGHILERREGGVLHLTLNRPEVRNAMSLAMVAELRAALSQAEQDGTRVIVLRGAGGHFCSGGDLKDMATARMNLEGDPQALVRVSTAFGEMSAAFAQTGIATVALLEGAVMGGGLGLACTADVVIAAPSASLRLPETSVGVVPAQIAPYLVQRLGLSQARRLAVCGARLDAAQALAIGLAHFAPAADQVEAVLAATLKEILQNAPGAVAATKALMQRAALEDAATLIGEAAQVFSAAVLSPEGMEGTLAFMGKRPPSWAPVETKQP